jgi:site-specific DNA recombinase
MKTGQGQRAALYARVSTSQQEEEATIESQIAAVEAYAQQAGYRLSGEHYYLDQAVSGAKLDRPGLNHLRDAAARSEFEVVLCLSPDRLARHYPYQWVIMDELQRGGIRLVFVNQLGSAEDPAGQFLLGMQALFAEYERTQITERLRRGRLYRMRQGQLVYARVPYGYRYLPAPKGGSGRWAVDAVEAGVIERMFRWYTEEGLTLTAIMNRLNECLVDTPPRGQRWSYSTVQRVLKQAAYCGRAYYNRTQRCAEGVGQPRVHGVGLRQTPSHQVRPVSEWVELSVPAIIPEAVWQQAQERMAMNQQFAARHNTQRFYLLRGLLRCGICGRTLVGRGHANGATGAVTYTCTQQGQRRQPDVSPHTLTVAGEIIEPLVWAAICQLLENPRLIEDAWADAATPAGAEPDEVDRLQTRLRALEQQWRRLLDAFQADLLTQPALTERKAALDQQREVLQHRLRGLEQQQRHAAAKAHMVADFATFCAQVLEGLHSPTPELKQEVIRLLIDHIEVNEDAIVIRHVIPTDDDCRLLFGRTRSRL